MKLIFLAGDGREEVLARSSISMQYKKQKVENHEDLEDEDHDQGKG